MQRVQANRRVIAPLILVALLLGCWYLAGPLTGTPSALLPAPHDVLLRLVVELSSPQIWPYLAVTATEAVLGCLLGAVIAAALALGIHRSAWISAAVEPFLGATQAIPAIALAPLLVLWFGYGLFPVVLLCALMVFFPVLIAAITGLRLVPRELIDAARIENASSLAVLLRVEVPLALPSVLGGLKNGFAISVTGAVVGEMVMGGAGLGTVLAVQRDAADITGMFATILLLCGFATGAYSLIAWWERRSRIVHTLVSREF